jgi:4-amino-4-deoxychorismate lyase
MMETVQQQSGLVSSPSHDFQITTALLWSMPDGVQVDQHLEKLEAHVLGLHCDRILAAARALSWTAVLKILDRENLHTVLCRQIPIAIKQSGSISVNWKVRVLVSKDGGIQILPASIILDSINGIPPWPTLPEILFETPSTEACKVLIDSVATSASEFTKHKTTSRNHYDDARARANIEHMAPTESEVLLFNEDRQVMEASLCTPYFYRDGLWITPPLASGGNAGVSRRMALEAGLCVEKVLHIDELVAGEMIWLSNAVRGFMPGRLQFQ